MKEKLKKYRFGLLVLLLGYALGRWNAGFSDFEQISLVVLGKVVETRTNEVTSVVLDESDLGDIRLSTLPSRLRGCLALVWRIRGVDVGRLIPAERIDAVHSQHEIQGYKINGFDFYRDKATGQKVRVYSIRSIRWIGRNQVLVSWGATHGNLDGSGSTLRMRRVLGVWWIVEDSGRWIS